MKFAIILSLMIAFAAVAPAQETNSFYQKMAAHAVQDLTKEWINSDKYPEHDAATRIGQGTCVEFVATTNGPAAPAHAGGIVVSRIITDKMNGGQLWVLVEFGEGYPWKPIPLENLKPIACSKALVGFSREGKDTLALMLGP